MFSEVSRVLDEGLKLAPSTAYRRRPRTRRRQLVEAETAVSPLWMPRRNTTHIDLTPGSRSTGLRIGIPSAAMYNAAMYTGVRVR